ncbi:MAG TPA: hypothetical protein VGD78_06885 [Chthoniobacterales bacterium]
MRSIPQGLTLFLAAAKQAPPGGFSAVCLKPVDKESSQPEFFLTQGSGAGLFKNVHFVVGNRNWKVLFSTRGFVNAGKAEVKGGKGDWQETCCIGPTATR